MALRALAVAGPLLALTAAQPAAAAGAVVTIWNDRIAAMVGEEVMPGDAGACWGRSGRVLDHDCARRELNRHRHGPVVAVTLLDEIAFLVERYADVVLGEEITRNTRIEFVGKSANLIDGDVEAFLHLKYRW